MSFTKSEAVSGKACKRDATEGAASIKHGDA